MLSLPFCVRGTRTLTMMAVICIGILLGGCANINSAIDHRPELAADLRTASDLTRDQVLSTFGEVTYRCERLPLQTATSGNRTAAFAWEIVGSTGTLVDAHRQNVGNLLLGDYFVAFDGSFVQATMTHQEQIAANTLTWALYRTQNDTPDVPSGDTRRFAHIVAIQRVATTGGVPRDIQCNRRGLRLLVPFSADYILYRSAGHTGDVSAP